MAAASSTSSFIGRERELSELRHALDTAASGRGRLLLLSGEAGIGKTRLAEEIATEASARGVRVAWGRCWEGGGAPPYWPWIQVLRTCLADADAERRTAILGLEATPQTAQHIAQLLPELHAAHPQNIKQTGPQPSDPEQARFQLFESVATILKNVGRLGPIVIVIDDLHDADHPSLLMQKFIAGQTKDARILMVGTYRDTEVRQSPELSKLIGDLTREGLTLPMIGLTESEVGEFIANNSGTKADEKLVADLYEATDGNPLFVDGIVRLLVAEGKFDRPQLGGGTFRVPDGVRESIRRRLLRLSEKTNLILSTASVIGNEFETLLLSQVSGSSAQQIAARMEDAVRAGIVTGLRTTHTRHRFSHALIREALYEDLAINRRVELHGKIASLIEGAFHDDLKPHLAALAHHFRESSMADKAIDYSISAGEAAEAVFAYDEAISHLQPALALSEIRDNADSLRRAILLLRLGHIQVFFEDPERGIGHLDTALKIFEKIGDDQHAGEVHSHLGRVFGSLGPRLNITRALAHLQRAEVLLEKTGDQYAVAMVHWGLAIANQQPLRISEALIASQKAMDIFAVLGERERWARLAGNRACLLMVKGKLAAATSLLDEIARAATSFVNPDAFLLVMASCAWYRILMNDPKEAARFYRLGLNRPGVMPTRQAMLFEMLTIAQLAMGDLVEAKRLAAGNTVNQSFRARIAFYQGDWKTAREMLQQALDWARSLSAKWECSPSAQVGQNGAIEEERVYGSS